jgi:hypothetical protein
MRILKRIVFGVLAIILILLILLFVVEPATWHWRHRREAVRMLTAAKTTNELQEAVGSLGVFVPVARDSGGAWFQSEHHFCGALDGYVRMRQKMQELRAALTKLGDTDTNTTSSARSETETALDAMFAAPSLEAGRQQLVKLGFEPLTK